jgi:hypothetical protein
VISLRCSLSLCDNPRPDTFIENKNYVLCIRARLSRKYLSGALNNFPQSGWAAALQSSSEFMGLESLSRRVLMITFAARLSRTLNNIFFILAPACSMKASRQRNNASRVCTRVQRSCTHTPLTLTHLPALSVYFLIPPAL